MRSQYAALMDEIVKRWTASEACRLPLKGCSGVEIEEIKRRQGVERLPEMYVEFLRRMGRETGGLGWHFGSSSITYPEVLEFKEDTFEMLRKPHFFIVTHDYDGDVAVYFHVDEDDPLLHWVKYSSASENKLVVLDDWRTLSTWLIHMVGD
jgi:hypothetical protein